jgi:hypothetical protein
MSNLGQALVFHLKYINEIGVLCDDNEEDDELPQVDGLKEDEVRELINKLEIIKNEADNDFSKLREKFNKIFEDALKDKFRIRTISKRNWAVAFSLIPKNVKKISKDICWIGMTLDDEEKTFKIWIWGAGGRVADTIFSEIFRDIYISGASVGWGTGNSILKTIKIPVSDEKLDVDLEPVFNEITTFLNTLNMQDIVGAYERIRDGFNKK